MSVSLDRPVPIANVNRKGFGRGWLISAPKYTRPVAANGRRLPGAYRAAVPISLSMIAAWDEQGRHRAMDRMAHRPWGQNLPASPIRGALDARLGLRGIDFSPGVLG